MEQVLDAVDRDRPVLAADRDYALDPQQMPAVVGHEMGEPIP